MDVQAGMSSSNKTDGQMLLAGKELSCHQPLDRFCESFVKGVNAKR